MESRKAISPVVSSVMVVAIVLTSTFLVMNQLLPAFEKSKEVAYIEDAKQILTSIDSAIRALSYEANGAKRNVKMKIPEGKFTVSSKDESIKYILETKNNIFEPGYISKEGNIIIAYGPGSKTYESDIDGDGETDIVLENQALIFAMRKLHSKTAPGFVNTTNSTHPLITMLKDKRTGGNLTPVFGIKINNLSATSYGQGYTELVEFGDNLAESSLRLYINATDAGIAYEVVFRLLPGQDYVQAEVKLR